MDEPEDDDAMTGIGWNGGDDDVHPPRRPRRAHPLVIALVALFLAGAVFAGTAIVNRVNAARAQAHDEALATCAAAYGGFAQTYTSYVATITAANALTGTDPAYMGDPDRLDELKDVVAPMVKDRATQGRTDAAPVVTDMDALAANACTPDGTTDGLNKLAGSFALADSQMTDNMIAVQYRADALKASIDEKRKSDSSGAIRLLLPKAKTALTRSDGKVDANLRTTLQQAVDAAQTAVDTQPRPDSATLLDTFAALQNAFDATVAAMPDDCHFHACVALTFDDGPNKELTPRLLDALKAAGAPSTFFVQGQFVSGTNVGLVRRMIDEGHAVGSLSWRHVRLHDMPADRLATWFADTDAVISGATGRPVTLFRPPDGAWSDSVKAQAKASGQTMILWNVDSHDWERDATAASIAGHVANGATAGSVIALHDGNQATIDAIPAIVEGLRAKGLTPVTVPQMFDGDLTPGALYYYLDYLGG